VVTEREGRSQGLLERHVIAGEVGQGAFAGIGDPPVEVAAVPLGVNAAPGVVVAAEILTVDRGRVDVPGQQEAAVRARRVGVPEHATQRRAVPEAAHAPHRPVVMIDRAVLLHEDHHVLDVVQATLAAGRYRIRVGRAANRPAAAAAPAAPPMNVRRVSSGIARVCRDGRTASQPLGERRMNATLVGVCRRRVFLAEPKVSRARGNGRAEGKHGELTNGPVLARPQQPLYSGRQAQ
jgi:hypothetical protein